MFPQNALMGGLPGVGMGAPPPGYAQPLNAQFPQGMPHPGGPMMQPPQFLGPPTQGGQAFGGISDFRNSLMDWRQMRPDHQGFTGTPQDWHMGMQDWRSQRPNPMSYFGQQPPVAPPPGVPAPSPTPNGQFPTAPPGQTGVNPYQFPTYLGG